jgi:mRNA interferase MazF
MTTKPKTDLPTHVYIESALRPSTLLCEQISTVSEERIGEWIGELTESEVQDLDITLAVSLGMKCGPGQLDTDTLEHLNNLQAELDRTKAELREAKSGPDYKLLYDQLIEKMLSR